MTAAEAKQETALEPLGIDEIIGGLRIAYKDLAHTYKMQLEQRRAGFTPEEAKLRLSYVSGAVRTLQLVQKLVAAVKPSVESEANQ